MEELTLSLARATAFSASTPSVDLLSDPAFLLHVVSFIEQKDSRLRSLELEHASMQAKTRDTERTVADEKQAMIASLVRLQASLDERISSERNATERLSTTRARLLDIEERLATVHRDYTNTQVHPSLDLPNNTSLLYFVVGSDDGKVRGCKACQGG